MPITPVGARRRITALAWLGWSPAALATVTGLRERLFRFGAGELARHCGQDTLDRIGAAYDLLWDTTPPRLTAGQQALAEATARHARKVGWAPPMAYDDDLIDAPGGGPVPGWKRPRSLMPRDGGLIEDIDFLRTVGYRYASAAQLAERLGRTRGSVERAISRDRQARLRVGIASRAGSPGEDLEATA